jgi:hypothetical protein
MTESFEGTPCCLFPPCTENPGLMPSGAHELGVRIHLPLIVPTGTTSTTYDWEKKRG